MASLLALRTPIIRSGALRGYPRAPLNMRETTHEDPARGSAQQPAMTLAPHGRRGGGQSPRDPVPKPGAAAHGGGHPDHPATQGHRAGRRDSGMDVTGPGQGTRLPRRSYTVCTRLATCSNGSVSPRCRLQLHRFRLPSRPGASAARATVAPPVTSLTDVQMARKLPLRMSWTDGGTRAVVLDAVEPCHEGSSCEVLARLGEWPWVVMAQLLSIALTPGLDTSGLMDAVMVRREEDH